MARFRKRSTPKPVYWWTEFKVPGPVSVLPRPGWVSEVAVADTSYYHEGRHGSISPHCVFQYTLAGRGAYRDAQGERPVPPGHGFLFEISDPDVAYFFPQDAAEPWQLFYVAFDGEIAHRMVQAMRESRGPIYKIDSDARAIRRLMAFKESNGNKVEISPGQGARLIIDLLLCLIESAESESPMPRNETVARATQWVLERPGRRVNATEMARALQVSLGHLTRLFQTEMGVGPYAWIRRQKVMAACRLLKETSLSVKEIAAQAGFEAPGHLNRSFRQMLHTTPAEFRRTGITPMW